MQDSTLCGFGVVCFFWAQGLELFLDLRALARHVAGPTQDFPNPKTSDGLRGLASRGSLEIAWQTNLGRFFIEGLNRRCESLWCGDHFQFRTTGYCLARTLLVPSNRGIWSQIRGI